MNVAALSWKQAQAHWFWLLVPALLLVEIGFARSTDWADAGPAEAAILFDLCLFVPALHLICYRRSLGLRALVIRTAAIFLLGIYVASWLVPAAGQRLLVSLSWLRPLGLAVLVLIELKLLFEAMKLVFSGSASAEQVAARSGAPPWLARLMLAEARFWKALWRLIRGR